MQKKIKYALVVCIPLFLASCVAYLPPSPPSEQPVPIKNFLALSSENKVKALTDYALAYSLLMKNKNCFSDKIMNYLLSAVKNDPDALQALEIFLIGLTSHKNIKDEKQSANFKLKWTSALIKTASKYPNKLPLTLKVATYLKSTGNLTDAGKLLEQCLNTVNPNSGERQYIEALIKLLSIYEKRKQFEKGVNLIGKYIRKGLFLRNLKFYLVAGIFFKEAAKSADTYKPFYFFESKQERYRRLSDEYLNKIPDIISSSSAISEKDMKVALGVCIKEKKYELGKKIILSCFITSSHDRKLFPVLADYLYRIREYQNSVRAWRKVFETPSISDKMKEYYQNYGMAAFMAGNYEEAINAFKWHLIFEPYDKIIRYQLAYTYFELGKYRKCINILKSVPMPTPMIKYLEGLAYRYDGDYKNALQSMAKAEQIAKQYKIFDFLSDSFYFSYAIIAAKLKDVDTVERLMGMLLKKNPKDAEAANFLGYTLAENNVKLDKAEKLIKIALCKSPHSAAYLDSMAWVLYRKGKYEKALEYMKSALKYAGQVPDAVIVDHAGDIYAALHNKEEALKYWRMALKIYSTDINSEIIRQKIKRILKK